MSIISSFFVLLFAIIIAIVSLWINEQYDYFELNLPFEISDYVSFSIDDVKSWFTTTKKRREIIETIDPTMLDEVASDLKEDYIALRNEMVNYKDHNDYLVNDFWIKKYEKRAEKRAENCSERERVATKVEREAEDIKKAEFMESKIGEEYEGIVSSVTQFGIFVELENTVEGLIRFENLGKEYFIYDEERKRLIGEKTNKIYKIGDKVKIRVISANKMLRQIDFEIIE